MTATPAGSMSGARRRFNDLLVGTLFALLAGAGTGAAWADSVEGGPPPSTPATVPPADASEPATTLRRVFDEIDALRSVRVREAHGVVHLEGEVANDAQAEQAIDIASKYADVVAVVDEMERTLSVDRQVPPLVDGLSSMLRRAVRALPSLLLAGGALALVAFAGHRLAGWTAFWQRIAPNAFLAELLSQAVRVGAVLLGLVLALNLLGAKTLMGTVLGGAGVLGLAIGFAVRDTIENYIASIMLSVRQPFRAGNVVRIDDYEGTVARLTSRATILLTADGNHLRIPNATVFKSVILNYSTHPQRRFEFELRIAPGTDPLAALRVGSDAVSGLEFLLSDPAPDARILRVEEGGTLLAFRAWIDQREASLAKARGQAVATVLDAFDRAGVDLAEDSLSVNLTQSSGVHGATASRRAMERPGATEPSPDVVPERHVAAQAQEEAAQQSEQNLLDDSRPME